MGAAGLTAAELQTLDLSDADAVASVGANELYSSDQLAALFTAYLDGGSTSSLTSDNLVAIGSLACGATSDQIGSMSAAAYKTAASNVGALSSCGDAQLTAYATLAKNSNAFGAISTWSDADVATTGAVIGGLTAAEMGTLTESQITAISTKSLAQIPPTTFAGMSASQIGYLSESQANSVTSEQ